MLELLPEGLTKEFVQLAIALGLLGIVIRLFFAYTIYSTLKLIKNENLCILPNQAWFVAMPFFNIYWNFEVVRRLTDSLNNEFFDRQIEVEENPTQKWGLFFAWTFLITSIPLPAFILIVIGLLHIGYFITYWVSIYQHKSLLELHIQHFGKDYTANKEQDED